MTSSTLPIISLEPFLLPDSSVSSKRTCAAALNIACRDSGFFYLRHSLGTIESRCLSLARTFFLDSTPEKKALIARRDPHEGGDGARGYQRLNENVTQGRADYHEGIDFYRPVDNVVYLDSAHPENGHELLQGPNQWPTQPEGFKEAIEELWGGLDKVGQAMMIAMAWALGYEGADGDGDEETERVFLRYTDRSFWCGRVIGYPKLEGDGEDVSCGEHSDYGCTTFLLTDGTKGALQVRGKDGEWLQADPVEGCYVVNIGDMMDVWTNGLWKSTRHRVVHKSGGYRVSIPYFYEPNLDAVIKPLEKCVEITGGKPLYEPVLYKDHLWGKVGSNFYKPPKE